MDASCIEETVRRVPHGAVRWLPRALGFVSIFALLSFSWGALRGTPLERFAIHDLTVRPAAALVNLLTPDIAAYADGSSLRAVGAGMNILNGCEGFDALFLLVAAFSVAPVPAGWRGAGLLAGMGIVFSLNQARILALFYAFRSHPDLFQILHGLVAPIGVILGVSGFFYGWVRLADRRTASAR